MNTAMVTVYWQNVSGWNLYQNGNLAGAGGWSASGGVTIAGRDRYH
ncbi:MAG: hypothetical protein ACREE6_05440 [Limisphaerales bacterium]